MSSVSKVIVDQKGNNSLLYLPLDKLLSASGANPAAAAAQPVTPSSLPELDAANVQRSRDSFRSRDRESR